jgi:tight adherence protein B
VEKDGRIKKYRKVKNRRASVKRINYEEYHFSPMEFLMALFKGLVLLGTVAYLFYDSLIAMVFLSPFLFVYLRIESKKHKEKRVERLQMEFKEALIQIGECMEAGYSVENSFAESYFSMRERFGDSSDMVQELNVIRQSLKLNVKIEDLLLDFAGRSGSEDVKDFAIVFSQAKRGGGNMVSIMKRTIGMVKDKIEIQKEIQIMISGKKYEQRIMSLVPVGVMAYMSVTSEGFFDVLYHNALGIVIMSVCLLVYGIAICLGEHLTKIEV